MLNEGLRTFTAGVAIAAGERVVVTAGSTTTPPQVGLAPVGATSNFIGFAEYAAAAGEMVTVRPRSMDGTRRAIASAAITVGAVVYGSANGRVSSTASGTAIGQAITAAAAAGDMIEIAEY